MPDDLALRVERLERLVHIWFLCAQGDPDNGRLMQQVTEQQLDGVFEIIGEWNRLYPENRNPDMVK